MFSPPLNQQPFHDLIQQQLTHQDIHLRQNIHSSITRPHLHPCHTPVTNKHYHSLQLKKQQQLGEQKQHKGFEGKLYQSDYKINQSNCNVPSRQVKINSLAYSHHCQPVHRNNSHKNKPKISVSLSLKQKPVANQPITDRGTNNQSNKPLIDRTVTSEPQIIKIKTDKQNQERRSKGCKIQQPDFHQRHPLQQQRKYNGHYLSHIIMQRALQPQTQPS